MPHQKTKTIETVADALLTRLKTRGVDYIFGNTGTDYPPLVASLEHYRQARAMGQDTPIPITVPHENVALNMAYGYYLATGQPQVVMVHTGVGTANVLCGLINANRAKIPLLVIAGKPAATEAFDRNSKAGFIHWAQEMFDQASMVREHVKWDYHLSGDNLAEVELIIDRALSLASADPSGPVYLTFGTEVMGQSVPASGHQTDPLPAMTAGQPDPDAIQQLAMWLNEATYPLIITGGDVYGPAIFEVLETLTDDYTIPVAAIEPRSLHIASTHPLYLGSNPHPALSQADIILILETDVPWIPLLGQPKPDCKVIHIGRDPLFQSYPRRGYRCDMALRAAPGLTLAALQESMTRPAPDLVRQRTAWVEAVQKSAKHRRQKEIETAKREGAMTFGWISHCVAAVLADEDIMVKEFDLQTDYLRRVRPGTYYGVPNAGGLGWGLGTALGLKLAQPKRTVVATVGDGCYYFGNPTAAHAVAQAQQLPFLTLVFNNAQWQTVVNYTNRLYPDLEAPDLPLTAFGPHPSFEKVIEAFGGYGEQVTDPTALPDALARALVEVKQNNRQALVNIIC